MSTSDGTYDREQHVLPDEELKTLDRLVGTWEISGGATGQVIYQWMEGGFFLTQEVRLEKNGQTITGLEIIGRERIFGSDPSANIKSRFYDSTGNTLDYVYELEGDQLTIWAGNPGSPAYFRGRFSDDDSMIDGEWIYPDGGGYDSVMTKVES